MPEKAKNQETNRNVLETLSLELEKELGPALARQLSEQHDDISADMTKNEAIAKVICEKAVKGDIVAAKYIYSLAKESGAGKEPFEVELSVADDEI